MGLGAAIAQIGLTNPTVAANMQAKVEASGDEGFQASVTQGSDASTGSTNEQAQPAPSLPAATAPPATPQRKL